MHGVGLGPVGPGVGDGPAPHVDDPVPALLDPLDIAVHALARRRRPAVDLDDPPDPPQVRGARRQGLAAPLQDRLREGPAVSARDLRGMRHGNVVGPQGRLGGGARRRQGQGRKEG
ncbi:hypothetical protein [Phenylobacterium parvum]|uniref:hypothetical protein n=1 Tax=Phenylobacterium parvum TaxID=2201350 RepID=UPI0013A5322F|nr:hypothetical protein [Phenylobacterium parvum]